ncbi:TetR/AcrR family transcriptional regulator [Marinobacter sp. M1N3S26]|uniref:TetR/AcrR family transcriptional regulator n=1 Tax=Marinobacter sp. M1N3S26 TaxID=3382299 RepID=UPI00387AF8A2
MAGRGRPRGFNREEALNRAMEVFWSKGYEHASMADLTAAMGLRPPSVYAAFGSKEGLFRAVVDHYAETMASGIWAHLEQAPTAREGIRDFLYATAEAFSHHQPGRGCMIVMAAPQSDGAPLAVCKELRGRRQTNIDQLHQRIQRAKAEGELPSSLDSQAIARYFATVQHGMSIQAADGADYDTLRAIADCAMAGWEAMTG